MIKQEPQIKAEIGMQLNGHKIKWVTEAWPPGFNYQSSDLIGDYEVQHKQGDMIARLSHLGMSIETFQSQILPLLWMPVQRLEHG